MVSDEPVALGSAQQRAVLALLLVRAPEPVSGDRLIDELWGERPPASAQHAVQVYVSGIRKALRAGAGEVAVRSSQAGYALELDVEQVDARRFERLLGEAQRVLAADPSHARALSEEALSLWHGSPLAELGQFDFARLEADRLEELRAAAVEGLVEARLACGEHREVIESIRGLVAANPLRERPRWLLMLALYRSGRHAEALAAYRDACAALDEIGLQPGPELRALEQAILRHDESLLASAEAAEVSADWGNGAAVGSPGRAELDLPRLPAALQSLVGRESEMSTLRALLARRDVRLITMLGPGGSGKTRLAVELACELVDRYSDGACFVSLAPLADPALVASEIARALGVRHAEGQPLSATLASALEHRELLLVLDNFEHLMAAAGLVSELLDAAPRLDILVTSREALHLTGENRVEVQGLPVSDAAELFLRRARAVRQDLAEHPPEREAVQRICLRLDGLPLALELAAARVALFSVPALEARLAQRLDLPEGARDLPDRQRTLRATIDWSYQLLSASERELFCRLAPFAGGARLEAIESIFTDLGVEPVELVATLVDKSLVRRREDVDGLPRVWMLETIREFARERAAADGRGDDAAKRHAEHFRSLTEEAASFLLGREQRHWIDRLEQDHANLRTALDYLTEHAPAEAIQMAGSLEWFSIVRGYLAEGHRRLEDALASAPPGTPHRDRALAAAGQIAVQMGDAAHARPLLLEALSLARQSGNARLVVLTLSHLSWAAEALGEPGNAVVNHQHAVAAARAAEDDWALSIALNNYAIMGARVGDFEQARMPLRNPCCSLAASASRARSLSLPTTSERPRSASAISIPPRRS